MESEVEGSAALGQDDGWRKGTTAGLAATQIGKGFAAGKKVHGVKIKSMLKNPLPRE
jgi:hypothetical protein